MPSAVRATEDALSLSVVLPVLNEEARLKPLLEDLARRFPDAEVIIVDGGSADRSVADALAAGVTVLLGAPGRAAQMNLGGSAARGDWLFFLHADCDPDFNQDDLRRVLAGAAGDDSFWGFCNVALHGRSGFLPVIAWFMNRRSRLTQVATGDQGLFVRRHVFEAIGGFAAIPLMEDIEISKRLRRYGRGLGQELVLRSSGRRWDEHGVTVTILRMWALRLAFWLGASPQRLWNHYYGLGRQPIIDAGTSGRRG
jgi:rSAM/selenodomain-associated transferase 2